MTTHYLDLTVLPDPETSAAHLLGALYERLHLALVQQRQDRVGVSFPRYCLTPRAIGNVLRLHGEGGVLERLMAEDWLKGVRDHVRASGVQPVPEGVPFRTVQRRQFQTNVERLRRRRMRRKGETAEQAARAIPDSAKDRPGLPYVQLRSRSTGQPFCMFLALGPLRHEAVPGSFNSYGLSGLATVPWF
ncbi:MAG: type I-F CRISPR-associated endoribonuclease Cas6/Csy4 [Gammaproteobacteria bacterium]|uniref:type I-F CRISPR-associated endoribonuclease Cas6/Csy4 n=1 Tax=Pseudomonas sp. Hp2 TaxID=701189 RepID=UPI001125C719|nr:type I-F CRISPR-associated endoribonuclease Cas6/Csy4 [Pseudomonas sp. Hp2]